MKTSIQITGQFSGNIDLRGAIKTPDCEEKKLPFNGYLLTFNTKKEAEKALWEGYKYMKLQDQFCRYAKKSSLQYDASTARILNPKFHS